MPVGRWRLACDACPRRLQQQDYGVIIRIANTSTKDAVRGLGRWHRRSGTSSNEPDIVVRSRLDFLTGLLIFKTEPSLGGQ